MSMWSHSPVWGQSRPRPPGRTACWRGLPPGHRTCAAPVAAGHPACSACTDGTDCWHTLIYSQIVCALPLPLAVAQVESDAPTTHTTVHLTIVQTEPADAMGIPQAVVQPQVRHPGRRVPRAQHDEAQRCARCQGVALPVRAHRYAAGGIATPCSDANGYMGTLLDDGCVSRDTSSQHMEWCS